MKNIKADIKKKVKRITKAGDSFIITMDDDTMTLINRRYSLIDDKDIESVNRGDMNVYYEYHEN